MESPNPNQPSDSMVLGTKRKRTPTIPDPGIHAGQSRDGTQINYLVRAKNEKLRLIEGDAEIFGDVLAVIDDYEGVLQRHESFAANLGAKLVGPLLLKSFEKLFDGPIKILQSSFPLEQSLPTWLSIITHYRSSPSDFILTPSPTPGIKTCRFWIQGGQVEISEDDWRLIVSGAPERMIPKEVIREDEDMELGTIGILEQRLGWLIKRADAVAGRARQLNYHLKGRRSAVLSRKEGSERVEQGQKFSAVNAGNMTSAMRSTMIGVGGNGGGNTNSGDTAKIQQQLLEQFLSNTPSSSTTSRRTSIAHSRPKNTRLPPSTNEAPSTSNFHTFNPASAPSTNPNTNPQPTTSNSASHTNENSRRLSSHPLSTSDDGGEVKVLMASKIEKLAKGERIFPPCDRCRRLRFDCVRYLSACEACTRKHAKCGWRDVVEGELDGGGASTGGVMGGGDNGGNGLNWGNPGGGGGSGFAGAEGIDHGRIALPSAVVQAQGMGERGGNTEQGLLSQIASAATAAGNAVAR